MYWVLGKHPWNKRIFEERIRFLGGEWKYVDNPDELAVENLKQDGVEKLFFMHWSYYVPVDITDNYECVVFHPTDLPYGRGGSPIQNLILAGHSQTKISAFRMTRDIDAGPIYIQDWLDLSGTAEAVYERMNRKVVDMIEFILSDNPQPEPQPNVHWHSFKRRSPEDSELPTTSSLDDLYDFIRMLDADSYPKAFLNYGQFRLEFTHANQYDNRVEAHVKITYDK